MNTIQCIKTRRSVRKYTDEPVEHEILNKIVEAASYAPSWKNTQIVRYTMVENRAMIEKIADEAVLGFVYNAKTIRRSKILAVQTVVRGLSGYEQDGTFSTDKGAGWEMYDAGISAQTFCLAAHEYGVGTVIMGIFDAEKIGQLLQIPKDQVVTAVIAMGQPAEERDAPARRSIEEIVRFL